MIIYSDYPPLYKSYGRRILYSSNYISLSQDINEDQYPDINLHLSNEFCLGSFDSLFGKYYLNAINTHVGYYYNLNYALYE